MIISFSKNLKEVPPDTKIFNEFAPAYVATLLVKMKKSNAI